MIKIEKSNEKNFKTYVLNGLIEDNKRKCQWFREIISLDDDDNQNFFVFDDGKIIGGAIGYILYGWYFLDSLWIDDSYRNKKIGTHLIKSIEEYVQSRNLVGIRMETWDFQAKGFYEKMGYENYASIEDCPPGTINYFFMKKFK